MIEICILIVVVVFCYLLGKAELSVLRLSFTSLSEQLLLATSLGLGSLAVFMFALGIAGLYYSWFIVPVLLVALLVLVYFNGKKEYLSIVDELKQKSFKPSTLLLLIVLVGLFYSLFQLMQCATPVLENDSLVAYLYVPKLYVQHQGIYSISWFNWDDLPLNIQMLNTLGILLYSEILSQLISGWLMGILCSLAVYVIARKFVNRSIALVSAVIFYTMPAVSWLVYTTKIDLGYAMFELCFWVLFVRCLQKQDKRALYVSAIFLGLAIGSKYHALFALVFAVLALFISLLKDREKFAKIVLIIFIFGVIALAIGCPSYIKNYAFTGDPFCPFLSNPDTGNWENINQYSGLLDYAKFQYNMVFYRDYFVAPKTLHDKPMAYLVIVFLPFLLFYKSIEKTHRAYLLLMSGYYLFLSFITFKSVYPFPRHFLPALGLLSVINAYGLKISTKWINKRIVLGFVLLGLVSIIVFKNIGYGYSSRSKVKAQLQYLAGSITKIDYLKQRVFFGRHMSYEMIQHTKTMDADTIIMSLDYIQSYYLDRPLVREEYYYTIKDYDALIHRLREDGITHVYFNEPIMEYFANRYFNGTLSTILEGISRGSLSLELQADDQYLYKILYD